MILKSVRNLSIIIPFLLTVGYADGEAKAEDTTATDTPAQVSAESEWTKAWDGYASLLGKNEKEALAILTAYCDSHPNDTNAIFETVKILSNNSAALDAIKYSSLIEGKPLSAQTKFDVLKLQGAIYHGQGNYKKAIEKYEKALEIFNSPIVKNSLAQVTTEQEKGEAKKAVVINFIGETSKNNIVKLVTTIMNEYSVGNTTFHINIFSGGGNLNSIFYAKNLLEQLPIKISTNAVFVGSSAVSLYCLGEKRYAGKDATFFIHNVSSSTGNRPLRNLKESLKRVDHINNSMVNIYKNCMTITEKEIDRYINGGDEWYLFSKEAKERGLVNQTDTAKIFPIKTYTIPDEEKRKSK